MIARPARILTIGVYGYDESRFVSSLLDAGADVLVDIRARRGMRGPKYAWANSIRLQRLIADAGIEYRQIPSFAPTQQIRELQHSADQLTGVLKSSRPQLDSSFVEAYRRDILRDDATERFLGALSTRFEAPVLLCVEGAPDACHRSLLALDLAANLGLCIENLTP